MYRVIQITPYFEINAIYSNVYHVSQFLCIYIYTGNVWQFNLCSCFPFRFGILFHFNIFKFILMLAWFRDWPNL